MEKEEMKEKPSEDTPAEETSEGVVLPEEFQTHVHDALKKATTKAHLSFIRDQVYAKEDEMRKAEEKAKDKGKGKGKTKGPANFSTEAAPEGLE
jgi:hypothetical protein